MGKITAILLPLLILLIVVFFVIKFSIIKNDGNFIYPLDDAYIHMAMAKNLAFEGQWGVTKYEFSSASSSILYTILNAISFKIFGINEYIPLFLNLIAVLLIFYTLWYFLKDEKINNVSLFVLTTALIFFSPLPSLIISGMEHTIQILINFIFIYLAAIYLEQKNNNKNDFLRLLFFAILAVSIRFEGIFIVAIISLLFLIKKDLPKAIAIGLCGFLPIIIFGIISVKNGSYFIPNSLLMKGDRPKMNLIGLFQYGFLWLDKLKRNIHLSVIFLWMTLNFLYIRSKNVNLWHRSSTITIIVILTYIIHLTFAKTGWFYRYEAYLVFLGIFSLIWTISEGFQKFNFQFNRITSFIAILLLLMSSMYPLYSRGKKAFLDIVPATKNIYEQQYQMGQFIKKYYYNTSVCANDIGAICFYADVRLFDMFGLASKDIIDLRIKSQFNKENIHRLAMEKGVEVVVIYDYWFIGKVPGQWKPAKKWEVKNNVILGGPIVTFFATELYDVNKLKMNLQDFSKNLPAGVTVIKD